MAKRVARFEKVTYRQFEKDWIDAFNVPELNMSTRRILRIFMMQLRYLKEQQKAAQDMTL